MSFVKFERDEFSNSASLYLSDISHQLSAQSDLRFEGFKDDSRGGHLGYQNGTTLAILNLYVTLMPPIKFRLNLTCGLEELLFEEFQDCRHGGHLGYRNGTNLAIMILHVATNASHQVSAQSDLRFLRCRKCEKLTADDGRTNDGQQTTAKLQVS